MEMTKQELKFLENALNMLVNLIELKDPHTARHLHRTAFLSSRIAESMQLTEDEVRGIYFGALMHDIGILRVPAEILYSIRKLTDDEMSIVKMHPIAGSQVINDMTFPWPITDIIEMHHERLNGSGYPKGLKQDAIPLSAHIVIVADVYESMVSRRPYSPPRSLDESAIELETNAGVLYHKDVVDHCIPIIDKIDFHFPEKNFLLF